MVGVRQRERGEVVGKREGGLEAKEGVVIIPIVVLVIEVIK